MMEIFEKAKAKYLAARARANRAEILAGGRTYSELPPAQAKETAAAYRNQHAAKLAYGRAKRAAGVKGRQV